MNTAGRAIWYIESHFGEPVTLTDVAEAVGLSRFHLSRTFAQATGHSLTAYLRGRRLSEAARALAAGAPDILSVALEACYGSHEAFSRAFRDQFGVTPEEVRARRSLEALTLLEPMQMPAKLTATIAAPETRRLGALLIAGMRRYFAFEDRGGIPALWQRFTPHIGHIPGEVAGATYGVCMPPSIGGDDGFDYLSGVAVRSLDDLPEDLVGIRIPARTWAVFAHRDHVSTIAATCQGAVEWLAREGRTPPEGTTQMVEFYGQQFNPRTGEGGCEVWMPVRE